MLQHRIENGQELAHTRQEGDLGRFAGDRGACCYRD